jgi:CspA family cold shock protein
MRGTVKRWVADRGFGFISVPSGDSIFAHISQVADDIDELREGDAVQFELGEGRNGRTEAKNIQLEGNHT